MNRFNLKISVLIPSLGRDQVLINTVRQLVTEQTVKPDEIVIVDQNNPPLSELDRFLESIPTVRHIRSATPGYAFNLNVCLREARHEIVLFLDDDVDLNPRLIEMHLENYAQEGDRPLGGIAGRVEQPQGDLDPEQITEVGTYHSLTGKVVGNFNALKRYEVNIAPGGNMSFKRKALVEAGGFDVAYDGNGYRAETDACLRVVAKGYRMIFEPRATLKHLMAPAGGARIRDKSVHTYYYVKNGLRLYRKHSPSWLLGYFALRMTAYVVAKAAYNRNPAILQRGLSAVKDGIRASRVEPRT